MKKLFTLYMGLSALILLAASLPAAPILDLQAGDKVLAALDGVLVSPRVGGLTTMLNGATYGGSGADNYVGADGVWAGVYRMDIYDTDSNLLADKYPTFCLSASTDPVMGTPLEHTVLDNVASDLKAMWATYHAEVVVNAVKAAAFQLAVWEVMHEGNAYDLASGDFSLAALNTSSVNNNGATLSGLISLANAYLDDTQWTGSADLLSIERTGYQPFPIEVPEPATMLILALGSLAVLRRPMRF